MGTYAKQSGKRLERASSFEIRAFYRSILSDLLMVKARHVYMRPSRITHLRGHAVALTYHTYAVSSERLWAHTFRPQTWT